jgi:predicted kinase
MILSFFGRVGVCDGDACAGPPSGSGGWAKRWFFGMIFNMKKMIMMRGPQGVGKSTLIKALGLELHALSSDKLRVMLGAPELLSSGAWGLPQERGAAVWAHMEKLCKERMERGETVALDAMFVPPADVTGYARLARDKGYEMLLVDFTDFPLERAIEQDALRPRETRVGEAVLRRTAKAFEERPLSRADLAGARIEKWSPEDGSAGLERRVGDWLRTPELDVSGFDSVVFVGDLQGCFDVVAGPGGPLEHGLDARTFYVFCGDLLDRGLENGKVLSWFLKTVAGRENAVLVWGNHEDHIWRWSVGLPAVSKEFELRTLPQLEAEGLTPADGAKALAGAVDILPLNWRGQKMVATHAGLPGLPPFEADGKPAWHLLAVYQLRKGAGSYSDPVDETFDAQMKALPAGARWTQVHGHRNRGVGALEFAHSVNLEDGVEFGGRLRMARLSEAGWEATSRDNKVFASWRTRFSGKLLGAQAQKARERKNKGEAMQEEQGSSQEEAFAFDVKTPVPAWITEEGSAPPRLSAQTMAQMRAHEGVMEKPMPDRPWIKSLSFTRDVFFDKKWDEVVVKARGLFVNDETLEVACRGYEKFFNIGERPETELSALSSTLNFPVVGYLKENGFLGNLGYDSAKDELMWASKSTTGGDFAKWFKEIFDATVTGERAVEIRHYLRDAEASFVFEVIDPERDPHMIDYPEPKLVLLDVFHRSEDGRKLPHDEMKRVAERFGLEPKQRMFEFKDMNSLKGWIRKAYVDLSYRYAGKDIEGVVFEDKAGFQTKCKLPHYGFWKSMRSSKDRLARLGQERSLMEATLPRDGKQEKVKAQKLEKIEANWARVLASDTHPMAVEFLKWAAANPWAELGASSVIELRKRFDKEVGIKPEWMAKAWDRFDPTEKEAPKAPKAKESAPAEQSAPEVGEPARPRSKM